MDGGVAEPVDRRWPATWADDELRLLWEFLGFLRATAVNKVAGLDRDPATAAPLPGSPMLTPLGVLKHLTAVERAWLSIAGGGADLPSLWDDDDVDHDWRVGPDETPASVVAAYVAEWDRSAAALAGLAPGDPAAVVVNDKPRTVRWLLAHVVQETARARGAPRRAPRARRRRPRRVRRGRPVR